MAGIIFLDFDGVLLTDANAARQSGEGLSHQNYLSRVEFDSACVGFFNKLLNVSGAEIVLSTSWASGNSFSTVANCLMRNGIDPTHIWEYDDPSTREWMTPRTRDDNRAGEIRTWLREHPQVTAWCAIDDRQEIASLGPSAVVTDPTVGFSAGDLSRALGILQKVSRVY